MLNRIEVQDKLQSTDKSVVIATIMTMVFNADTSDVSWVSQRLIELLDHKNKDVEDLAIISFGHLARIYNNIGNKKK